MTMRVAWFGDLPLAGANTFGDPRRVWPDIDIYYDIGSGDRFADVEAGRSQTANDLRALCLAPDTDHDYVRVFFGPDDKEGIVVGPGMLVRVPCAARKVGLLELRVAPVVAYPATRLGVNRKWETFGGVPSPVGSWDLFFDGVAGQYAIRNTSAVNQTLYQWHGGGFGASIVIAPGGLGPHINTTPLNPQFIDHATDPTGQQGNLGDLIITGAILKSDGTRWTVGDGKIYGSHFAVDSNGTMNDSEPADYISAWGVAIDNRWYGKCGLLLFEGEDPSCDFRPRLTPERVITLGQQTINPSGVDGQPDVAIVTMPAMNVESVQATILTTPTSAHPLDIALTSPTSDEFIDTAGAVKNYDTSGPAPSRVAIGGGAATAILSNIHDLVQLIAGGSTGQSTIAAGSTIVLRRKFIG